MKGRRWAETWQTPVTADVGQGQRQEPGTQMQVSRRVYKDSRMCVLTSCCPVDGVRSRAGMRTQTLRHGWGQPELHGKLYTRCLFLQTTVYLKEGADSSQLSGQGFPVASGWNWSWHHKLNPHLRCGWQEGNYLSHYCCLPGAELAGSWRQDLNSRALRWERWLHHC